MTKNYVSISGVTDKDQLENIARIKIGEEFTFPLAIGYQVSNKSINEGTQNTRQPKFAELGDFDRATRAHGLITCIHYYTKDNATIIDDLERIFDIGVKPSLLQFNTLPPSIDLLGRVKEMGFKTILKVAVANKKNSSGGYAVWKGESVVDVNSGNVEPLVKQVYDRRELIDYVMFDASHGTNLELDLNEDSLSIKFGREIIANNELKHLGLVYAGSIKPSNVRKVVRSLNNLLGENVSIDSESGVRTDDKLDSKLVRAYLREYKDEFSFC